MTDWPDAGQRHEISGGHWHEPDFPSCVVCRMRELEMMLEHAWEHHDQYHGICSAYSPHHERLAMPGLPEPPDTPDPVVPHAPVGHRGKKAKLHTIFEYLSSGGVSILYKPKHT